MVAGVVQLVHEALSLLQGMGYPGVAAIVGLESLGLPLPGETTLLAASYLAAAGRLSLPLVIGSATLGAVVGDSVGYAIGRRGGRRFLERYGRYVRVRPQDIDRAGGYFERHGAKTVFFARFVVLLRVLAGPLAGAARMPYRRFLAANAAGAVTWATMMGTLAFFFGKPVAAILGSMGAWALAVVAVSLVGRYALNHLLARRAASREALTAPAPVATAPDEASMSRGEASEQEVEPARTRAACGDHLS